MHSLKHIRSLIYVLVVAIITVGMFVTNLTEASALSEADSQVTEEVLQEQNTPEPETQEILLPSDSSDTDNINVEDALITDDVDSKNDENISGSPYNDEEDNFDLTDTENSSDTTDTGTDISSDPTDANTNTSSNPTDTSTDISSNPTDTSADISSDPADTSTDISSDLTDIDKEDSSTNIVEENPSDSTNSSEGNASVRNDASEVSSEASKTNRPLEKVSASSDRKIHDNHLNTIRILSSFSPSRPFPDATEKVKYNVSLPIDGIPAFITQEMIIGALKCQDETGFPASVTIAQIIQESGYGYYGEGGDNGQGLSYLAYQYCNLFGIKGEGPAGTVTMRTSEQTFRGTTYTTTAGFRVYNTYTECIEDRTKILKEHYFDLTKGVSDANTFAMKIGSRWATSRTYAQNLIEQIERYDLYRLDEMTLEEFSGLIGRFANPCPGAYKTSDFGYRSFDESFHKGIDLGTGNFNLPTYAAESGTVIKADYDISAGNWIVIDHGNGLISKYMHHKEIYVKEGQHVEKGQQIGLTGSTGYSTGNHLHFQVEENGSAIDPSVYLYK